MKRKDLSVSQFADEFQCSRGTVYNWISSGAVRAFKTPGGVFRIPPSEIGRVKSEGFQKVAEQIGVPLPPPFDSSCPESKQV